MNKLNIKHLKMDLQAFSNSHKNERDELISNYNKKQRKQRIKFRAL